MFPEKQKGACPQELVCKSLSERACSPEPVRESPSARAVRESPLQEPLCESPSARAPPREPRGDGRDGGDARGCTRGRTGTGTERDGRQILLASLPTKIFPPRAHTASHRTHETKTKKFPGSGSSNNGNTPQPPMYIFVKSGR